MQELVERLAANAGVDRTVAEKAIGIILDFLATEGPPEKIQPLLDRLPGSAEAIAAARASESGGLFGSLGGIMGVGSRLMGLGLDMGQIQAITREVIAYSREQAGEEAVGEVVGAIPGLSQFV